MHAVMRVTSGISLLQYLNASHVQALRCSSVPAAIDGAENARATRAAVILLAAWVIIFGTVLSSSKKGYARSILGGRRLTYSELSTALHGVVSAGAGRFSHVLTIIGHQQRLRPNGELYLHQFLPILAHIIPPHLLDAGRLESLPRK
jgi:hypothetical protein